MMDREEAERLISGAEGSLEPVAFNFGALPAELSGFETARVVVLPIPYDLTSSYRTGSRHGPTAVIEASRNMELYDHELEDLPARFGIHTFRDLEVDASGPEAMARKIEGVVRGLLEAGKIVAALGGEHSITSGIVRAYVGRYPDLAVLHVDAHADLRDSYQGTKYSHACTMRRVREMVACASHVGIRSLSADEASYVKEAGIRMHSASDWDGGEERLEEVLSDLGDGPVYVTCDLDAFDPALMPSVGTPEPGGLSWEDVVGLLRVVSTHRDVVGFDVVELTPISQTVAPDFVAARLVYKLIGFICCRGAGR